MKYDFIQRRGACISGTARSPSLQGFLIGGGKIIFSLKTGKCGPRRLSVGNLIAVEIKNGGVVFIRLFG